MFKPAQHKINDHQAKKHARPSARQTSRLPVGHAQGCHKRLQMASLRCEFKSRPARQGAADVSSAELLSDTSAGKMPAAPWGAWQASIQPLRRIMTINGPRQFYVAYATQIRPSHVNLRVRSPVMEGLLPLFACIRTMNPIGQFHVAYAT